MKRLLIFIVLVLMLGSCKKSSIKNIIADKVENKCQNMKTCTINMQEVTNFKWDKVYLFSEGTSLEDIDKALGFHYSYFEDIASRIVFVLDHQVVYHEDEFPYPNKKPLAGVLFKFNNDTIPHIFTLSDANFSVKKTTVKGNLYYELTPTAVGLQ